MTKRILKTSGTLLAVSKSRCCILPLALAAAIAGPAWAEDSATHQSAATSHPAAPEAASAQSVAPAGAHSYFVNLHNGQIVNSPFKVVFGLTPNMGVAPSGVEKANV